MKLFIWGGLTVGSILGGLIPSFWGAPMFSFASVILSAVGGLAGIWAGLKLARAIGL